VEEEFNGKIFNWKDIAKNPKLLAKLKPLKPLGGDVGKRNLLCLVDGEKRSQSKKFRKLNISNKWWKSISGARELNIQSVLSELPEYRQWLEDKKTNPNAPEPEIVKREKANKHRWDHIGFSKYRMKQTAASEIKTKIIETFFGSDWKLNDDGSNPILLVLGDFVSNESKNFRGMEVSPQKAILDWFKGDRRFVVIVMEECYTTRTCSSCGRLTLGDSFQRSVPRDSLRNAGNSHITQEYGGEVKRLLQGLKWCGNCETFWGRDLNAAINMRRKFMAKMEEAFSIINNTNNNNKN